MEKEGAPRLKAGQCDGSAEGRAGSRELEPAGVCRGLSAEGLVALLGIFLLS